MLRRAELVRSHGQAAQGGTDFERSVFGQVLTYGPSCDWPSGVFWPDSQVLVYRHLDHRLGALARWRHRHCSNDWLSEFDVPMFRGEDGKVPNLARHQPHPRPHRGRIQLTEPPRKVERMNKAVAPGTEADPGRSCRRCEQRAAEFAERLGYVDSTGAATPRAGCTPRSGTLGPRALGGAGGAAGPSLVLEVLADLLRAASLRCDRGVLTEGRTFWIDHTISDASVVCLIVGSVLLHRRYLCIATRVVLAGAAGETLGAPLEHLLALERRRRSHRVRA
jgi:hypothetical protein